MKYQVKTGDQIHFKLRMIEVNPGPDRQDNPDHHNLILHPHTGRRKDVLDCKSLTTKSKRFRAKTSEHEKYINVDKKH